MTKPPFKTCTACDRVWSTREELLNDSELEFTGYQAFVEDGVLGLFLFDHEPCGTTLAISASRFEDLRSEPIYEQSSSDLEHGTPYCLTESSGAPCPEQCECTFVREVVELITKNQT